MRVNHTWAYYWFIGDPEWYRGNVTLLMLSTPDVTGIVNPSAP